MERTAWSGSRGRSHMACHAPNSATDIVRFRSHCVGRRHKYRSGRRTARRTARPTARAARAPRAAHALRSDAQGNRSRLRRAIPAGCGCSLGSADRLRSDGLGFVVCLLAQPVEATGKGAVPTLARGTAQQSTARHGTAEAAVVAVHSSKSASRENLQAKAVSTHHTKCDATYTIGALPLGDRSNAVD